MAPSTPPPPRSGELAALTTARTAASVMSPWTRTMRRPAPSLRERAPLVLVVAADDLASRVALHREGRQRARRKVGAGQYLGERPPHGRAELEALAVPPCEDEQPRDAGDRTRDWVAVRRPRVEPDPRSTRGRALEYRHSGDQVRRGGDQLVEARRGELDLAVERLPAEADRILVARPDDERVAELATVP